MNGPPEELGTGAGPSTRAPRHEPGVELIHLASGRRVAVRTLAVGSGERTVVFCHPAPGSGAFLPNPDRTAERDLTVIAIDRPGYGLSDRIEAGRWATVDMAAADIAEVLGRRGGGPIGVAGWSAGGRVALALAARHPELVERVVVIGTPAPHEHVPWIPGEHVAALEALRGAEPAQAHAILEQQLAGIVPADPASDEAIASLGLTEVDEAALSAPGSRERLAGMFAEAFRQGAAGLAADIAGYTLRPWGFEPAEVRAKTLLLFGARDPVAGARHANWWRSRLADARLEMVPEGGHFLIVPLWSRILSHLAPGSKKSVRWRGPEVA